MAASASMQAGDAMILIGGDGTPSRPVGLNARLSSAVRKARRRRST
jgi:diacylglycerol kinase family enzyme